VPGHDGDSNPILPRPRAPHTMRVPQSMTPSSESFAEHGRRQRVALPSAPLARRHQLDFSMRLPLHTSTSRPCARRPRSGPDPVLSRPRRARPCKTKRPSGSPPKA
jgi:hypothetical protein